MLSKAWETHSLRIGGCTRDAQAVKPLRIPAKDMCNACVSHKCRISRVIAWDFESLGNGYLRERSGQPLCGADHHRVPSLSHGSDK